MVVDTSDTRVRAVRVLRRTMINYPSEADGSVSLLVLNGGEVISDPTLATWLMEHVPQHVVAVENRSTIICPNCGATADKVADAAEIMVILRDCSVTLDNGASSQFYRLKAGSVVSHTALRVAVLEAKIPVEFARGMKCPSCHRDFY